ncbi:hypothetical protein Catovirus_1_594 [Catovirus CTV1]|uniref:Uncharacterized protein n=1 Tax=Catovirus CTV1 TaxID=1977631 RepID=A0A1V0SA36_9VIRU|nr:hypothetical protein Catovirus_1_594 [Catovirus CTV1]
MTTQITFYNFIVYCGNEKVYDDFVCQEIEDVDKLFDAIHDNLKKCSFSDDTMESIFQILYVLRLLHIKFHNLPPLEKGKYLYVYISKDFANYFESIRKTNMQMSYDKYNVLNIMYNNIRIGFDFIRRKYPYTSLFSTKNEDRLVASFSNYAMVCPEAYISPNNRSINDIANYIDLINTIMSNCKDREFYSNGHEILCAIKDIIIQKNINLKNIIKCNLDLCINGVNLCCRINTIENCRCDISASYNIFRVFWGSLVENFKFCVRKIKLKQKQYNTIVYPVNIFNDVTIITAEK